MTQKRIRQVYQVLLSIDVICAGLCLIVACVGIYRSGARPFSREAVAEAFSEIAVAVYIGLALILAGWIGAIFFPGEKEKLKPEKQDGYILARLQEKLDWEACPPEVLQKLTALQRTRCLHRWISLGLLAVCSAIFLIYALNGAHFPSEGLNEAMVKAMGVFLPCLAVPFGYAVFAAYQAKKSFHEELLLTRQAIRDGFTRSCPATSPKKAAEVGRIVRWAVAGLAVAFLVYGFLSGGTEDVLTKAANICTECVGLG